MEMILTGIENKNEYYTNHYFTSIFQENAEDTIKKWKEREKAEEIQLPWKKLRDVRVQYYNIRDRYLRSKNEEVNKPMIQELAELYLNALGYEMINSVTEEVEDGLSVPIFHEETKTNGAPLLWAFLTVAEERDDDILQGKIFEKSDDEEDSGKSLDIINDDVLAKLFFAGEEAPRFIMLIGINQIALIDRNKWNEKRYLQFMMEDIYSRHEESTFMAMTVLLHKESLCPLDGSIVLDSLDENSHKHSAGVSDALKYALRESIEILGNEVIHDMKNRQGIDLEENPIDAAELTLECLRYMYRFLFMLFIEARPELGYAPMKSQTYLQGYSLEGLRDVCDMVTEDSEALSEGYYIDDTLKKLFHMTYYGYPESVEEYKKAIEIEKNSMYDAFTIEALKAHIFDPEYTKLITKARLRNSAMLQIVDLMSISRPGNTKERKGRISYSALGINQMGAVYEALLSYDLPTMHEAIKKKNSECKYPCRMLSGDVFPWISMNDKTQIDIILDGFSAQWNKTKAFAVDPKSIDEVGCIHTSQGMEFEYVGLIIGDDLVYRNGRVETDYTRHPEGSGEFKRPHQRRPKQEDSMILDRIIRNTYKVLFTRGQKGLYLYVMDPGLRDYLRIEIEHVNDAQKRLQAYAKKISELQR